ncbi:hypothetical protein D3C86_1702130 [compost metagenome]
MIPDRLPYVPKPYQNSLARILIQIILQHGLQMVRGKLIRQPPAPKLGCSQQREILIKNIVYWRYPAYPFVANFVSTNMSVSVIHKLRLIRSDAHCIQLVHNFRLTHGSQFISRPGALNKAAEVFKIFEIPEGVK